MIEIKKLDNVTELRKQRERECFPIVNRGKLWYECLGNDQLVELRDWYYAWLNVTDTKVVPTKPAWLNDKLKGEEIRW